MRLLILGNQQARTELIKAWKAHALEFNMNSYNNVATIGSGVISTESDLLTFASGAGRFSADALYPLFEGNHYDAIVRLHSAQDRKFPVILNELQEKLLRKKQLVVVDFDVNSSINDLFINIHAEKDLQKNRLEEEELTLKHREAASVLAGTEESPDSKRNQRPSFLEAKKATNADLISNAGFLSTGRERGASSQTTSASDNKKTSAPTPRPGTDSDEGL